MKAWRAGIMYVALALLALASYLPVRKAGFVYDDLPYVLDNAAVHHPTLANVLTDTFPPGRPETALYRPGVTVSYILDRWLSGGEGIRSDVAHAHNLALHLGVCLLLLAFLSRVLGRPLCFLTATLYAVHPILTESVAWVTGRSELLVGFWAMAGVTCLRLCLRRPVVAAFALTVCSTLAFLCKESAVILPFAWAAVYWCTASEKPRLAALPRLFAPAVVAGAATIALRWTCLGAISPAIHAYTNCDTWTRVRLIGMCLARYAELSLLPLRLSVHWPPLPVAINPAAAAMGWLMIAALVAVAIAGLRRRALWGAGAAWFLVALFPYSNTIIAIGTIFAERFMYTPLLGLTILAGACIRPWSPPALPMRQWTVRWTITTILAIAILLSGVATYIRTLSWQDELTLWRAAARTYPEDIVARVAHVFYLVAAHDPKRRAEASLEWQAFRQDQARSGTRIAVPASIQARMLWIESQLQAPAMPARASDDRGE